MKESAASECLLTTPEGVTISFDAATAGDRIAAFLLDMLIIIVLLLVVVLASGLLISVANADFGEVGLALLNLAAFLLFNFYFLASEMSASGTTIGKRRLGLRVIARDGGPLTAEMIVARNLTRDLEIFLPATVLLAPESLFPQEEGLGVFLGVVWLLVLVLMPLFNRRRLRIGDMIAGTLVVAEPSAKLLPDLADSPPPQPDASAEPAPAYEFSREHLEHYGVHELQVLEDFFRKFDKGEAPRELLDAICERIRRRIGWETEQAPVDAESFLRAFYRAQRAHLERNLLFGKRKERKSDNHVKESDQRA